MKDKMTITKAAKIMGVTPQFLRICLQREKYPFGFAVLTKEGNERYTYYINEKQLYEYLKIDNKELAQ